MSGTKRPTDADVTTTIILRTARKEGAMNPIPDLEPAEFAALGEGEVAYVKPIRSEEARELFPQAPQLQPGLELFALLSASGAPIMLTDSRDAALANAWANDLHMVSIH